MPNDPLPREQRIALLEDMILIRAFEERVSRMAHEQGRLPGMQITCVGQEAVAAGVVRALLPEDVLVTNHRSHGHMLARGVSPDALMAEIMGKRDGLNRGKSGTLHMADPAHNVLMTSTVVGAAPLLAMGAAFAQDYRGGESGGAGVTCVFFGDGAAAEGSVHEAMNLAAVWKLPVLFVCESNCWAGAQAHKEHCPIGRIADRAASYGMPGEVADGNDVERVHETARTLLDYCRAGRGPALMECLTYRMHGHGEQDPQHYVDKIELAMWAERDPIVQYVEALRRDLAGEGPAGFPDELRTLRARAEQIVDRAVAFADQSPFAPPEEALDHLYAAPPATQEG
ncbi:dehydrogenase E1 component [Desulfovibrio sp. X2]|uniref:thiamine pyrophosphate-dependent dehydrogenase E1 component subunit alpha n=1 Tax=Desulfovibrio sp. X2 TaxID=941449 RepID=UPI00035873BE|nr:thiamine pyrophosphate-dependent dehydrogenase E1 component subunit alpha [Desulfovibrio sp. X2]EPR43488.1 dehydrogenase E1 component [Desulfovibrio sp. X2]